MSGQIFERPDQAINVLDGEDIFEPKKYVVIMHNDDYTTQEFVVHILMNFFFKNQEEAHSLMLMVHQTGQARVGIYTKDIALSKVSRITSYSREQGMPLRLSAEQA